MNDDEVLGALQAQLQAEAWHEYRAAQRAKHQNLHPKFVDGCAICRVRAMAARHGSA